MSEAAQEDLRSPCRASSDVQRIALIVSFDQRNPRDGSVPGKIHTRLWSQRKFDSLLQRRVLVDRIFEEGVEQFIVL